MSARVSLSILLLLAVSSAQSRSQHGRMTVAEMYSFHGRIHTQKCFTRELEKDPRSQPKLALRPIQKSWMVFDESGELIEEGDVGRHGEVRLLVRRTVDANGQSSSEIIEGKKITRVRTEKNVLPDGSMETKTFVDDKLQSAAVSKLNETHTAGDTTVTDATGKTLSRSHSQVDGRTHTTEFWSENKFVSQWRRVVDSEGNTVETSRYDESGKLVSTMSFNNGELTSFWQDPDCKCTNVAGFHEPGSTVFYRTERDGALYKEVQLHPGRRTNHEIDGHELYDQNGRLLEKIVYTYVSDGYGNWTKRTTSVLDLNTNSMVPVQEDTRELTYY